MKKAIFGILVSLAMVLSVSNLTFASSATSKACGLMQQKSSICGGAEKAENFASRIVGTLAWIVGALSVIMIIWAGIQYVISAGDSGKIGKAKNTLIYSIVGLVIAVMAGAIVEFILKNVG